MNQSPTGDPADRVRTILQGYPEPAIAAGVRFAESRDPAALDRLVLAVLSFHLPPRPEGRPDLATFPRSTRLVADLAVDSLTFVELGFLIEDLLGVKLEDDELRAIVTLDDLLRLLHRRLGLAAAAP